MSINTFKSLWGWILLFSSLHVSVTSSSDLKEDVDKMHASTTQIQPTSGVLYHGIVNAVRISGNRSDIVVIPQIMMSYVWMHNLSLMDQAIKENDPRAQRKLFPFYVLAPMILFSEVLYGDMEYFQNPYFVAGMFLLDTLYILNGIKYKRCNLENLQAFLKMSFSPQREKFKNR